ncbi:glycosyltransferase [uncultured Micrococcus sp.]|uniref:glycosyltransferase n=1 Tax=uncultured Micrococcus sp. TaxID=114051 RepID=UPI0025F62D55|nr:glycosyltransferase family 4 protein [uncultured Micrococcus sp.]
MRVAILAHRFLPETGGEVTADVLARGFTARHGAEVPVVTRNPAPAAFDATLPYRVLRGPSPAELLTAVLNQAAVAVLPSVGLETFGTVVLKAQAAGCAVVASRIGGIPEALGGTGVLVEPGDVAAWADALHALATDDDAFAAAHRGREENVAAHRTEVMVDRYGELVQQAHRDGRVLVRR